MLVRREWQPEELIASWTLVDRDWELVANQTGATRLGFALLLKFFDLEGRFPAHTAGAAADGYRVRRRACEGRRERARALCVVGSHDRVSPRADPGRVRGFGSRRARMRTGWRGP
jgi:hypothetical protein